MADPAALLGRAAELWDDDCEQFVAGIYERRREDRERQTRDSKNGAA